MFPRLSLAALTAAFALAGCAATSMTAAEVRVPVLLGPVPCIACGAGKRQPTQMPVAHVAARERAYMLFLPLPPHGWGDSRAADVSQPGISPDRLFFGTSCQSDLQLSDLRAEAWMLSVPPFYYYVSASIEAEASQVAVPGASCGAP